MVASQKEGAWRVGQEDCTPVTAACVAVGAGAEVENRSDLTPQHYLSWSGEIPVGLVGLASLPLDKRTAQDLSIPRGGQEPSAQEEQQRSSFLRTSQEAARALVPLSPTYPALTRWALGSWGAWNGQSCRKR